jgi:hypothetical protein
MLYCPQHWRLLGLLTQADDEAGADDRVFEDHAVVDDGLVVAVDAYVHDELPKRLLGCDQGV